MGYGVVRVWEGGRVEGRAGPRRAGVRTGVRAEYRRACGWVYGDG